MTNTVGPSVEASMVEGTSAYAFYLATKGGKRRGGRQQAGDMLHETSKTGLLVPDEYEQLQEGHLWVAFQSVFQGDHIGVEIATQAHECLLQSVGLLDSFTRVTAPTCLQSSRQAQGLVIDDFFCPKC